MSTPPLIDPDSIEALKAINPDDGGEFVREILQIFMEDTPARIAELDDALFRHDTAKFVRAAHSIKGSSSNIGAQLMRETAEQLEVAVRDKGFEGVEYLVEKLKSDFELTGRRIAELKFD